MTNTIITVKITLTGSDHRTQYDLQSDFLELLPERLGRATIYDARIIEGLVDADDVPIKNKKDR